MTPGLSYVDLMERLVWLSFFAFACARSPNVAPESSRRSVGLELEMAQARANHSATLLEDGSVLLVGGERVLNRHPIGSVERFVPGEGIVAAAPLPEPRANHQALRLSSGRVLVVGGGRSAPIGVGAGVDVKSSALLYDPATDEWTRTGDMSNGRSHFGAALLPSGRVLVVGGTSGLHEHRSECTGANDCGPLGDSLASAEIYDPQTRTFLPTGSLAEARTSFAMATLADGRLIVIGGMDDRRVGRSSTEVYDERTGTWRLGPTLPNARVFLAAHRLPSGHVLVAGGKIPDTRIVADVELLNVDDGVTMSTLSLVAPATVTRLVAAADGTLFAIGGFNCEAGCRALGTIQRYDETSGRWTPSSGLVTPRATHTATLLHGGWVLVCGGFDEDTLRSCEIIDLLN